MTPKIEDILAAAKMHPSRAKNIYVFGSRVYGTHSEGSDWDVVVVGNSSVDSLEIKHALFNIHVYTPKKFQEDLDWHMPKNLECAMAPEWAKLKQDIDFRFELQPAKLRHAISHVSSNSWVKAKKKLTGGEYSIGVKSLFHAIRIPMFGTQIAASGSIGDFGCANHIWNRIKEKQWDWNGLDAEFRAEHNRALSEFRKLASK